jgi:hypothetical protein
MESREGLSLADAQGMRRWPETKLSAKACLVRVVEEAALAPVEEEAAVATVVPLRLQSMPVV